MSRIRNWKQNRASDLIAFTDTQKQALRAKSITNADELWERVRKKGEFASIASDMDIQESEFLDKLEKQAKYERANRRWRQQTVWVLRVVFIALLVLLVVSLYQSYQSAPPVTEKAIVPVVDLPAFHVIQAGDVTTEVAPVEPNMFTSLQQVAGRYTLRSLAAGTTLRADHLSEIPLEKLNDQQLLALPMKQGAIIDTLIPGRRISVVLAPREHCCDPIPRPLVLNDAIVWVVNRQDNAASIVVALKGLGCESIVGAYLAVSDVFMFQPVPEPISTAPTAQPARPHEFPACESASPGAPLIDSSGTSTSQPTAVLRPSSMPTTIVPTATSMSLPSPIVTPGLTQTTPQAAPTPTVLPATGGRTVAPIVGATGLALLGLGLFLTILSYARRIKHL